MIIEAARRLDSVGEYYFSKKLEQIRKMNAQGRDVINLGIGSPDLAPSENAIAAARRTLEAASSHGYASYRSTPELRRAISQWYERVYAVKADPEREVLPLLGSKEGLFYIAMAFLNPGDRALVPNPGYPTYMSVTNLTGATPIPYELSDANSWWPDFNKLESMDLTGVKLMWVNYPHMPTGASGSADLFRRLIEFGRKHRILICHDNPYSMVLNETLPMSLLKFDPEFEVSLELNSFSKAFNMAGWRIGMMLGSAETVDTVLRVKSNVDSGMFLPIQHGAIEALNASDEWHAKRNEVYRERRVYARKIFDHLGFHTQEGQVGLFQWAKAPASVPHVEARIDEILDRAAVFLTPGVIFGSAGNRYARCSLCAPVEKLKEALQRLEKHL